MNVVQLCFASRNGVPELTATRFSSSLVAEALLCERGKLAAGRRAKGSFQWTTGVMALVAVLIKARLGLNHPSATRDWLSVAGISSDSFPGALALDSAVAKHRNWLLDMFGHDAAGLAIHRRLFIRSNPEGKRPGPVRIALNSSFIDPRYIELVLNGRPLTSRGELADLLQTIGCAELVSDTGAVESGVRVSAGRGGTTSTGSSFADVTNVVARAITDMEGQLAILDTSCPSRLAVGVAEIEQKIPSMVAGFASGLLIRAQSQNDRRQMVPRVKRSYRDNRVLMVQLPSPEGAMRLLAECPIDQPSRCRGIQIVGSTDMLEVAPRLARDIAVYWRQIYGHLHDWLATRVRRINSTAVDELYSLLRRYMSAHGISDGALSEFSLFVHVGGRARYLLDDLRYRRIREILVSVAEPDWSLEGSEVDRHLETEAWYASSIVQSADTMSYTEALMPMMRWTGTSDTWHKPIPGFGASEIAVYGKGAVCAEPLAGSGGAVSLCAVFPGEYTAALGGKFLEMPLPLHRICANLSPDIASLPFGHGDRMYAAE